MSNGQQKAPWTLLTNEIYKITNITTPFLIDEGTYRISAGMMLENISLNILI